MNHSEDHVTPEPCSFDHVQSRFDSGQSSSLFDHIQTVFDCGRQVKVDHGYLTIVNGQISHQSCLRARVDAFDHSQWSNLSQIMFEGQG